MAVRGFDSESLISDYSRGLSKLIPGQTLPVLNVALVFTHPSIVIEAEDAPVPTIPLKKLKDLIRKRTKGELIPQETVDVINELLSK